MKKHIRHQGLCVIAGVIFSIAIAVLMCVTTKGIGFRIIYALILLFDVFVAYMNYQIMLRLISQTETIQPFTQLQTLFINIIEDLGESLIITVKTDNYCTDCLSRSRSIEEIIKVWGQVRANWKNTVNITDESGTWTIVSLPCEPYAEVRYSSHDKRIVNFRCGERPVRDAEMKHGEY